MNNLSLSFQVATVVEVQEAMVVGIEVMEEAGEAEAMGTRVGAMEAATTTATTEVEVEAVAVAATLVEVREARHEEISSKRCHFAIPPRHFSVLKRVFMYPVHLHRKLWRGWQLQ